MRAIARWLLIRTLLLYQPFEAKMAAARADLGNALINLASGDPDIRTPAHITAAAVAAIDSGEHHVSAAPQNVLIELPPECRK